MHANHSPLQFFGLTAMVSALASRVYANAARAWTMVSTAKSNGASASLVPVGTSWAPETGPRSRVNGTRTALDSNRTSRAPRSATTPGGLLGPTSGPPESALATPGQQLGPITTSTEPAEASSPTPPGALPALTSESSRRLSAATRQARPPAQPSGWRRPRRRPRRIPPSPTPVRGLRWRRSSLDGGLPRCSPRRRRQPRRRPSRRRRPRQGSPRRSRPSQDCPRHSPSRHR